MLGMGREVKKRFDEVDNAKRPARHYFNRILSIPRCGSNCGLRTGERPLWLVNTGLSEIKKPACGRLLGGGFGLFLVSRTRLQSGHPARCGWVWGVAAFCCLPCIPARVQRGGVLKCDESYWGLSTFPRPKVIRTVGRVLSDVAD